MKFTERSEFKKKFKFKNKIAKEASSWNKNLQSKIIDKKLEDKR